MKEKLLILTLDELTLLEYLIKIAVMQLSQDHKNAESIEEKARTDNELTQAVRLKWKIENMV
jgi:hypothetical protein